MKLLVLLALLSVTISANAGIKEKKIIKAALANAEAGVEKVKKACGNKNLTVTIEWSNWDSLEKDKLKCMEASKNAVIPEIFTFIEKVCLADADYKEELAKLTKLNISGKKDKDEMYAAFELKETTMNVQVNLDGYGSWKNEELLKQVWE